MRSALLLGGGGFIGSSWYAAHASDFDRVTIVDRFHGPSHGTLSEHVRLTRLLRGQDRIFAVDVADIVNWPELLREATDIFILNADTGTGSSFERPAVTVDENLSRLARLIEAMRKHCDARTVRVMFTSSRAVYGEGHWRCTEHGAQRPDRRPCALAAGRFAPRCSQCGVTLTLTGSCEDDAHRPASVYGLTKSAGEALLRLTLCAAGFDVRIVRYQNVYGIGQAIDNPYTGVLNWFSRALLSGNTVSVFEQGHIVRDFLFISDAADLLQRLSSVTREDGSAGQPLVVNGGSGVSTRLGDAARALKRLYGGRGQVGDTSEFRQGDVLGALADTERAQSVLGFNATVSLDEGLSRYAAWFRDQHRTPRW